MSVTDCRRAIDHLVEYEGRPEILQLSGGEPTVHPEFEAIFEYACSQPIDIVMVNTNGIRMAKDARLRDLMSRYRQRSEVYLQFDGFDDNVYQRLRGEALLESKLQAIDLLSEAGVNVTLVCTVDQHNLGQVGRMVEFGMERKRPKVRLQPPKIGEHNKEILLQYGFEKDEIQSLYRSSVLTDYKRIKILSD